METWPQYDLLGVPHPAGCRWSDGTPITADDIVYTYVHLADPSLSNPWVWFYFPIKGVQDYNGGKAGPEASPTPRPVACAKWMTRPSAFTAKVLQPMAIPAPICRACSPTRRLRLLLHTCCSKDPLHWADNWRRCLGGPYMCTELGTQRQDGIRHQPQVQRSEQTGHPARGTPNHSSYWLQSLCNAGQTRKIILPAYSAPNCHRRANPKLNPLLHSSATTKANTCR